MLYFNIHSEFAVLLCCQRPSAETIRISASSKRQRGTKRPTTDRRTKRRHSSVLQNKVLPSQDQHSLTHRVSPPSLQSACRSQHLETETACHGRQLHGKRRRGTVEGIKSVRRGDSSFANRTFRKQTNCLSTFTKKNSLRCRRKHEAGHLRRVALPSAPCSAPVGRQPRYIHPCICVDGDVLLLCRLLSRRRVRQLRPVETLGKAPVASTLQLTSVPMAPLQNADDTRHGGNATRTHVPCASDCLFVEIYYAEASDRDFKQVNDLQLTAQNTIAVSLCRAMTRRRKLTR